ncbi:radical SAM/SPASM domain-containing protein [Heliophilum fasciatum]|uniref:MoaA/NifB/PqqE/SkfB family radical SAM enzyme n=1 Tax=Heliophilum fasciatum TaxID=35700 RepID=A0A4R2RVX0_9FIRM|nr:radical SAM protein [Heliophilum fasciatum]MCW2278813.1 MoaA/NifB/PqqE/SkfB family radical SAM enzyme [Heliophilum fasciatum]TCP64101.1 MoaA/NifB/PqqE/SkfB family radical SAM enzyme [Heliophilum fasciatum]
MSDKAIGGITPSGKRTVLGTVLPLDTPFLVQIFPVYACNFRCGYCLHSLPREQHGYISDKPFMDMYLYKQCIDDMRHFKKKLKMLRFAGIGEPLLHKRIADMVAYAKKRDVAESVEIVTNGVLLTEELSLSLIHAGLDKLRISIQGISAEKYKMVSWANIDMDEFINKLRFFHQNKGYTKIHIKIIDCALSDKKEELLFFKMFEAVCDSIAIEHLTPTVKGIDYSNLSGGRRLAVTQSGTPLLETSICPQPFYMMQINPDGAVVPCCSMSYPLVFRERNMTIPEIWNSEAFLNFRRQSLDGTENVGGVCASCSLYKYGLFPEDRLEPYVEQLKKLISKI